MKKRLVLGIALVVCAVVFLQGSTCDWAKGFLPKAQPYPYEDSNVVKARAMQLSADMEAYIRDWLAGRVPAAMPKSVLPDGIFYDELSSDENKPNTEYINPMLIDPLNTPKSEYIGYRPAYTIDWNHVMGLYADPHCTYIALSTHIAPFGTQTVIQGQFPYSRYFSIQPSPPFDPTFYYYQCVGIGEVPLIDADITPDSGSVNPFKVGANRLGTSRNYTVTIKNTAGQWTSLMPTVVPPNYRLASNIRYGSGIHYMGPGVYGKSSGKGRFFGGQIWMRYYGIDKSKDALAGVPLPSVYSQLSSGEKFLIKTDMARKLWACNKAVPVKDTAGADPTDLTASGAIAFRKYFGVDLQGAESAMLANGWTSADDKTYVRNAILGAGSRGANQPGPGGFEIGASLCSNIHYITHGITLNTGKVWVLCGKLPTFPNTRGGASTMQAANLRYMSFTTYWDNLDWLGIYLGTADPNQPSGCPITSIMDDDLVLDANRNYVICYSRAAERPSNATSAAKVTWVNFGGISSQGMLWRWLSVGPEWAFSKTPDEVNCTWKQTSWSSELYDNNVLGNNQHDGFLKEYKPRAFYMDKAAFEGLGSPVAESNMSGCTWNDNNCFSSCGSALAKQKAGTLMILFPLALGLFMSVWSLCKRRKR